MNHLIDYLSHSLQYAPSLSPSRFFPVLSQSVVWHYVDGRGQKSKVLSDGPEQMIIAVSCWCMFNQRQIRKRAVAQTHTHKHTRTNVQWSMFDKYMVLMTRQIMRFSTRLFGFLSARFMMSAICANHCVNADAVFQRMPVYTSSIDGWHQNTL